uniref:c-type cytochrome domain-containing protein n=1 Tax=Salmonella sp. SAL4355 TaxID=3159876 RepID=UPI00397E6211
TCHNDRSKSGGLSLEKQDVSNIGAHAEVWEQVVQKLRGNLMPPPGRPKPDRTALDGLTAYL